MPGLPNHPPGAATGEHSVPEARLTTERVPLPKPNVLNLRSKEPKIQQIQYNYHQHALLNKKTVYIYILRCGLNTHFSKLRLLIYCISISYRWIHCSSVPTFHLHSSVNSVGCHQDHFSTHVRVCSSRQEFYACQRIEFKNLRQLSAEQHLCHSLSTPI